MSPSQDQHLVRLLRETLEGVLSPNLAMALLFDALRVWGPERPQTAGDYIRFVRGPLMEVLIPRLGAAEAASVGGRIVQVLTSTTATTATASPTTSMGTQPAPRVIDAGFRNRETTPMPTWQMPVAVVIASRSWRFADRLTAAIGAHRVAPITAGDAVELANACRPYAPGVVVIDGEDPPAIEPEPLARLLADLPATVLRTLWADTTEYAQRAAHAAARAGVTLTPLGGRESILPLCDIVRSLRQE